MEQDNVLDTIRRMAPLAAEKMKQILSDPKSSQYAKIQVITLILNRTYGMPESSVKVAAPRQTMEESIARVRDLFRDMEQKEKTDDGDETGRTGVGEDRDGASGTDREGGGVQGPDTAARGMDP